MPVTTTITTLTMVPAELPTSRETAVLRGDGRAHPAYRERLRRIPSFRNAASVAGLYAQTAVIVGGAVWLGPWSWPAAVVLMGRTHAQFASLMHEAAHRLLFSDRRANDFVGRWMLGFPAFASTDAYRRVHMAHHREEFGPDEPDMALYAGYPVPRDSLRRKLVRDATGQTGYKLFKAQLRGLRSPEPRVRHTLYKILGTQAVLLGVSIVSGHWWVYPVLWVLPYMTVWRVINRLRSIAEHGGMEQSKDRRRTTHSVRQHAAARFLLVPYNIGWHLAHHVDAGIPFRNLPEYHRSLTEAGYVDTTFEYPGYGAIWKALTR